MLGLTTPPKVEVRESSLLFEGKPGAGVVHTLDVAAVEKRPIFASAVSDQSWLKVSKVVLNGRTAHVQLAVDPVPDRPGETLSANLTVRANGNQRFVVPVSLRVFGKPHTSARPSAAVYPGVRVVEVLPDAATYPAAIPLPARPWQPPDGARANGGSREPAVMEALPVVDEDDVPRLRKPTVLNMILPLLPVAFILFGLFVTASRDLVAWRSAPRPGRTFPARWRARRPADRHPVPRPGQGGHARHGRRQVRRQGHQQGVLGPDHALWPGHAQPDRPQSSGTA